MTSVATKTLSLAPFPPIKYEKCIQNLSITDLSQHFEGNSHAIVYVYIYVSKIENGIHIISYTQSRPKCSVQTAFIQQNIITQLQNVYTAVYSDIENYIFRVYDTE